MSIMCGTALGADSPGQRQIEQPRLPRSRPDPPLHVLQAPPDAGEAQVGAVTRIRAQRHAGTVLGPVGVYA